MPTPKLPVMVWIHGGAHRFGAGTDGFYTTNALPAQRRSVLVSINYRLGVFGYLGHRDLAAEDPDGSTGNYGLLDQIRGAALGTSGTSHPSAAIRAT